MDSIDVVSHINDIINCSVSDKKKVEMIKEEIRDYFNEFNGEKDDE